MNTIRLMVIKIDDPQNFRGQGDGSDLIKQAIDQADKDQVILKLHISELGGLSINELTSWSIRNGFNITKTAEDGGVWMLRNPLNVNGF